MKKNILNKTFKTISLIILFSYLNLGSIVFINTAMADSVIVITTDPNGPDTITNGGGEGGGGYDSGAGDGGGE